MLSPLIFVYGIWGISSLLGHDASSAGWAIFGIVYTLPIGAAGIIISLFIKDTPEVKEKRILNEERESLHHIGLKKILLLIIVLLLIGCASLWYMSS